MATLRKSAELSTVSRINARDIRAFLSEVPDAAEIMVDVYRGDERDRARGGLIKVTLKAEWTEGNE